MRSVLAALFAAALTLAGASSAGEVRNAAGFPAKIVFVDVGQGDGVVMKIGGKIVVSDTGEYRLDVVQATLRTLKAKRIDVLILSHPHQDHVKNAIALLAGWDVDLAVLSRSHWWQGTDTNRELTAALKAEPGMETRYAHAGDKFDWGGAAWTFLNPRKGDRIGGSDEAANVSLVYLLKVNGITALFTGDIESDVAKRVARIIDPVVHDRPVDIFLATHHGSKEGSIKELLDVIRPRWAVLSTGPNGYGHPSREAIRRLHAEGASIWCTAANGSITVRISATGALSWRASRQPEPWWSAKAKKKTGSCVGR